MSGYELKNLPFFKDVKRILDNGTKENGYRYKVVISTVNDDIEVLAIKEMDIIRDYMNAIGDNGTLRIQLSTGDYFYKIYPFIDNLEITILNTITKESYRYKALLLSTNDNFTNRTLTSRKIDELVLKELLDLEFQIVDRVVEPLRIKTTQGSYRNVSLDKLLSAILSTESGSILVDGKPAIDSIDISPIDNTTIYKNITIKSNSEIIDLPELLHKKHGGLYNGGLGTYIQKYNGKNTWFTYPVYTNTRVTTEKKLLVIYITDSQTLPILDITYYEDHDILNIIANGEVMVKDSGGNDKIQKGSGFRMANASSFMKKPVIVKNGKVTADRSKLNYEVAMSSRADGLNYAPSTSISNNPFVHYSSVLASSVIRADLVWENSNIDLLYPGMPCKLMRPIGDSIKELNGTLVFVHTFISGVGNGFTDQVYRTNTQLTVLLQP